MIFLQNERWLQSGYYIRVYSDAERKFKYYWLREEENLPEYIFGQVAVDGVSFGSVDAGDETGFIEIEDLKPAKNRLYQLLVGVRPAGRFYFEIPSGESIWGTDERPRASTTFRKVGGINQDISPFNNPSWVTEFFLMYNIVPHVNYYNSTSITTKPEVRFIGKMFLIDDVETLPNGQEILNKLVKREIPFRPITIGTLPGKGRSV